MVVVVGGGAGNVSEWVRLLCIHMAIRPGQALFRCSCWLRGPYDMCGPTHHNLMYCLVITTYSLSDYTTGILPRGTGTLLHGAAIHAHGTGTLLLVPVFTLMVPALCCMVPVLACVSCPLACPL